MVTAARLAANRRSLASAIGAGIISSGAGGGVLVPAFLVNFKAANTAKARNAFKAVAAGTRNADILAIGDSTTAGQSAGNAVVGGGATAFGSSRYDRSWPNKLADELSANGFVAGANGWMGFKNGYGSGAPATFALIDPRHVFTGNWQMQGVESAGGLVMGGSAAGASDTFTPQAPVTTFVIYATQSASHGKFLWSVDGGATTEVNTGVNPLGVSVTTVTVPKGVHSLKIEWITGGTSAITRIIGVDAYDNTRKEITVRNLGVSGIRSGAKVDPVGSEGLLFDSGNARPYERRNAQRDIIPSDLWLLEGGACNDVLQAWGKARSAANLRLLIQDGKVRSDVIFFMPPIMDGTTGDTAIQAEYADEYRAACMAEDIPYIDLRLAVGWRTLAEAQAAGFMSDFAHPTAAGYADMARIARLAVQHLMTLA